MDRDAAARRAWRAAWLLVAATTALHLLVAGRVGLGTDEAHYALYGLHLDWSYFDHPPMVGWLCALAEQVSTSDLALRVVPVLLTGATALLAGRVTARLFPEAPPWTPFVAVALVQSAALIQVGGMFMVPEIPLVLCGLLVVLALRRVEQHGRLRDWLALGLLIGLAGLSKYTAVTLVFTAVAVLLAAGRARDLLCPGPWLAVLVAAVLVAPVVLWNARHDWISFTYQIEHGTHGSGWSAVRFLASEAAQVLAYGPALVVFGAIALVVGWRERRHPGVRLVLLLAWPVLLLFGWSAGKETTLPHWTALGWLGAAPLAARWLVGAWDRRWVRRLTWISGGWSVLVVLVVHAQMIHPWLPFPEGRDPTAALVGWDQAAADARALQEQMAAEPGPPPRLFVDRWSHAARLAWYARPEPVIVLDGRFDQFDLWFGEAAPGDRGVLVVWDDEGELADPAAREALPDLRRFARHALLGERTVTLAGRRAATFYLFGCEGHDG